MIVLTATRLEERAARRELHNSGVRIVRTGVGAGGRFDDAVISCGLAGGVRRGVPSGTVLIPNEIMRPNGERVTCDPELAVRLRDAARTLGEAPISDMLVTTTTLVRGAARAEYAAHDEVAGVDMESGLIYAPRIAVVRVILDTPEHELSDAWLHPLRLLLKPFALRQLPWLATHGPRYAALAAHLIRKAIES